MSKEKCCGNCKHFKDEDANGVGLCCRSLIKKIVIYSYECCVAHERKLPGWTEITPYNVDLIDSNRVVVTDGKEYRIGNHWHASLSTLAKVGGYYYYVLPELETDEAK